MSSPPVPQPLLGSSTTPWLHHADLVGVPIRGAPLPDFLTICPSRTGTTWLAHHLSRHPGIYVPPEKELRYFDARWRAKRIDWYHGCYRDAGSRLKGELTPSYALLPSIAISTVQRVNPRLKLIFLARRLPQRAWSHTRHCCRHYEGVFRNRLAALADLPAADLVLDFLSDYALSSADYSGILLRWLEFFPPKQFFVRYFEDAVARPEAYLKDLLDFLGVKGSLPEGDLYARINEGSAVNLPDWAGPFLENLFAVRQTRAVAFFASTFGLKPVWRPPEVQPHDPFWIEDTSEGWRVSLHRGVFQGVRRVNGDRVESPFLHDLRRQMAGTSPVPAVESGLRSGEEQRLDEILRQLDKELTLAEVVHVGVLRGFNLVRWKRLFFGIRQSAGAVDITMDEEVLRGRHPAEDLIIAASRRELEVRINAVEDSGAGAARFDPSGRRKTGPDEVSSVPHLVGSYRDFNLVHYGGRVYGLRQSLGPVDLTASSDQLQRFRAEDFIVAESEAIVLARIDSL